MKYARPLPQSMIKRYHGWKALTYEENAAWYRRLASEGQRPRTLVIYCCDSRVDAIALFGAEPGEFFVHRNIANMVPPYAPDGQYHGTSSAIEYAVTALKVSQIIVLGHSLCGGVKGCHDMCSGHAPELEAKDSFVGRWMDLLRPAFDKVKSIPDQADRLEALEKQGVLTSLENLMTFPFVAEAVESGDLALHGLWTDIHSGAVHVFDADRNAFLPI